MKKILSLVITIVMLLQTSVMAVPVGVDVADFAVENPVVVEEESEESELFASTLEQWYWPGDSTKWTTYNNHRGIDIQDPMNTNVKASKSGIAYILNSTCNGKHSIDGKYTPLTCTVSGCKSDTGKCVWISHGDGSASCYMHLNSISITNGATVKQGDVIGKTGTTGPSSGPHLHFEIGYNSSNPKNYWSYSVRDTSGLPYSDTKNTSYVYSLVKIECATITEGDYYLKNGTYYIGVVSDKQAIGTLNTSNTSKNKFNITKDGNYYKIKSASSSNGYVMNVWCGDCSINGAEVTLYGLTTSGSQRWYFEEYNGGYLIHPGDNASLSLTRDTSTNKLYVNTTTKASNQIWLLENINQRTVAFNPNGGNVSTTSKSVVSGEKYGDLPTPTRNGYTFNGWYTSASGGTEITSDTIVNLSVNQTLYAQWSEKKVTSITVVPTVVELLVGNTYTLSASVTPSDALNKTLTYTTGNASVATINSSGVITAVKEGNTTITVKASSGITSTITIKVYANDGFAFGPWVSTLPGNVTSDAYIIEEKTVYRYRDNTITTQYGSWGAESTTTEKPTESDTLRITSETISKYNYFHYCMNYYDGRNWVDSIPYGSGQHLYHTKQTTTKLSAISDADKGNKQMYYGSACSYNFTGWFETTPTYTYKYQTRTVTNVTTHGAWSDWQDLKPENANNRDIESVKNYRYKLKIYTVSFDANGGSDTPANQTKAHGTNLSLSSTKPTKTGYTFNGWSTTANGSVVYAAGAIYSENKSVILYAVWEANKYTVTYNANGGTGTTASQTKTHDIDLTLSSIIPTKTGYTFLGWSTSANGSVEYASGATYLLNNSVTLYAVWEKIPEEPEEPIEYKATMTLSDVSGKPGDTVKVAVSLKTDESINTIGIKDITYDKNVLTFTGFSDYEALTNICALSSFDDSKMAVVAALKNAQVFDGNICILNFKINENAEECEVSVSAVANIKLDSDTVVTQVVPATVAVSLQLLGDIDLNETVDLNDAILLLQYSMFPELYPIDYSGSVDFTKDGNIDMNDAILLLQYSMFPELYPIE